MDSGDIEKIFFCNMQAMTMLLKFVWYKYT
jgi:hypothetical protein